MQAARDAEASSCNSHDDTYSISQRSQSDIEAMRMRRTFIAQAPTAQMISQFTFCKLARTACKSNGLVSRDAKHDAELRLALFSQEMHVAAKNVSSEIRFRNSEFISTSAWSLRMKKTSGRTVLKQVVSNQAALKAGSNPAHLDGDLALCKNVQPGSSVHNIRSSIGSLNSACMAAETADTHRQGREVVSIAIRNSSLNQHRGRDAIKRETFKADVITLYAVDSDLAPILLVGGPYQGMRLRENWHAKGIYIVNGAKGEFVYKLHQRIDSRAIAVPFGASPREIQSSLFKLAGMAPSQHRRARELQSDTMPDASLHEAVAFGTHALAFAQG